MVLFLILWHQTGRHAHRDIITPVEITMKNRTIYILCVLINVMLAILHWWRQKTSKPRVAERGARRGTLSRDIACPANICESVIKGGTKWHKLGICCFRGVSGWQCPTATLENVLDTKLIYSRDKPAYYHGEQRCVSYGRLLCLRNPDTNSHIRTYKQFIYTKLLFEQQW